MAGKSTAQWLEQLESEGIPCGRINRIDEALNDPQVAHRKMRVSAQHASLGEMELLSSPMKLSDTPPQVSRAPPLLGEHTEEVLSQLLNYSQEQIQQLRFDQVI